MRKIGFLAAFLCISLASTSFGHIAAFDPQSMAYGDAPIQLVHDDTGQSIDSQKGQWILQITNSGSQAWTDFHFEIFNGSAIFQNPGGYPMMVDGDYPANFTADLSTDGKKWDIYFPADVVVPGETVTFTLFTNNQATGGLFAVLFYPTVPEPATLAILGLGGLLAFRRKIK